MPKFKAVIVLELDETVINEEIAKNVIEDILEDNLKDNEQIISNKVKKIK